MRNLGIKREKSFLGKWMDYYVVIDIPQDELAEHTGVKKYALGFPKGLLQHSKQIFAISNDKSISIKAPEDNFVIYAVYFDSSGIRFGPELNIEAGEADLSLKLNTRMGLSSNKLILTEI